MAAIICPVCQCKGYHPEIDKRGMVDAVCDKCGTKIKKMSMAEVVTYFATREATELPKEDTPAPAPAPAPEPEDRPLCKWCTEDWGVRRGLYWVPIPEITHCPMCGRKLKASDRAY